MDNPETRNALDRGICEGLHDALDRIHADPDHAAVRCVVLTGARETFCSGIFLDPRLFDDPDFSLDDNVPAELTFGIVTKIRDCRVPVIAAVDGAVAGAGFSVLMACDFAVASARARFALSFVARGLVPDLGATSLLVERLGRAETMKFALTRDRITADEARALGLVQDVVAPDALMDVVGQYADRIARLPPLAVSATKALVWAAGETPFADQLERERAIQDGLGKSADFRESVAAFLEKREPRFRGR